MKRLIPLLLLALAAVVPSRAQVIRNVGYCNGDKIDVSGAYFGAAGTYTVGAIFTSDFLETYDGCRIIGMRVAAACDLGRTRMFVYQPSSLTTPVVEQRQRLYKGWNDISFSGNGLVIDHNTPLFVGFDYVETAAMVTAEEGGLCCSGTYVDGGFAYYNGSQLQLIQFQANLCIQLIIDASSLPADDMKFGFFDPGYRYHTLSDKFDMMASVENVGTAEAKTFTLAYRFDNLDPVKVPVTEALASGSTYSWQLSVDLPQTLVPGPHTFSAWVEDINGNAVQSTKPSRTLSARFCVYTEQLKRHYPFVEIYSDQGSYYSAAHEEAFKATAQTSSDFAQVVSLFGPEDALHLPQSKYWYDTYAYTTPSFTINRSYFPAEKNVAYSELNDYLFVMPDYMITGILSEMIMYDNSSVCLSDISLSGKYDAATHRLDITAAGNIAADAAACYGDLGVTLMLVEDGVVSPQIKLNDSQKLTTDLKFVHDNVLRAYITSPQGDKVTPAGNTYTAKYSFDVNPNWNVDNLRVVGIVGAKPQSLTAENLHYYDVADCNAVKLKDLAGVEDITADEATDDDTTAVYYTIDGRAAAQPLTPGLYIRRTPSGKATKVLIR